MNNSDTPISMNEHLSAVLDDEAGSFEQRRVLDELKTDSALADKLSAYSLIGETMRANDVDKPAIALGSSFLAGIHDQIDKDDAYSEVVVTEPRAVNGATIGASAASKSWLRPVGGFAVAASVAVVAFMGLQQYQQLNPQPQNTDMVATKSSVTPVQTTPVDEMNTAIRLPKNTMIAKQDDQYIEADTQTRSLLKRYVDSHMQYASTSAFVPSVRTIAYTDNQ